MTTLPNLVFLDTNILVYAHDPDEGRKHKIAVSIVADLWERGAGAVSTQVLQEFYSVVTRKRSKPLTKAEARDRIANYSEWRSVNTDTQLLISATLIHERHKVRWWDALIIEAAIRCGAKTLLSEDLQHRQRFGEVTVRNPFIED